MASLKQLEKKVDSLSTRRGKQIEDLAFTEEQLGHSLNELSAARKSEPMTKAPNKPKAKPAAETPAKSDEAE